MNLEPSTAVGGRTREHRTEPGADPLARQESHAPEAGRLLTCLDVFDRFGSEVGMFDRVDDEGGGCASTLALASRAVFAFRCQANMVL